MIFAHTYKLVLSGRKTQTLRLAYPNDRLEPTESGKRIFEPVGSRVRWRTGSTYAVQPERCHPAKGRILVADLFEVLNPLEVDDDFVSREGFNSREDYLHIWNLLHKKEPIQRCWAIVFRLTQGFKA